MNDPLVNALRLCCVHVLGERPGTGFFITERLILTCNHVLGEGFPINESVHVEHWNENGNRSLSSGVVIEKNAVYDLALIELADRWSIFAPLHDSVSTGTRLISVGFPTEAQGYVFDQFTAIYEGQTVTPCDDLPPKRDLKFKHGQVEHGYSGAPLLNHESGYVIGVVTSSRATESDLGGWAVSSETISLFLEKCEVSVSATACPAWSEALEENARSLGTRERRLITNKIVDMAPPLPTCYVERKDITSQVVDALLTSADSASTPGIVSIHGMGGIGKSVLAAAVCKDARIKRSFSSVFWASLGQHPDLLDIMRSWLLELGERSVNGLGYESTNRLLREVFAKRDALIVIDDIWSTEHAEALMVGGGESQTLMTYRRSSIALTLTVNEFRLEEMSPRESLELISRRLHARNRSLSEDTPDEADLALLAEDLGHLPLALDVVGALLSKGYSARKIRALLATPHEVGVRSATRDVIDRCVEVSVQCLRAENPYFWRLFSRLGICRKGVWFNAEAASNILGIGHAESELLLQDLSDDALLQIRNERYRFHDVVHDIALRHMTAPEPEGNGLDEKLAHEAVISQYQSLVEESRWDQLPWDGYCHSNLIWHLHNASLIDEILRLLTLRDSAGQNAWYNVNKRSNNVSKYLVDLGFVNDVMSTDDTIPLEKRIIPPLLLSSLNSHYSNLDLPLYKELILNRYWSPQRAEALAESFENETTRLEYKAALLCALFSDSNLATDARRLEQMLGDVMNRLATTSGNRARVLLIWQNLIAAVPKVHLFPLVRLAFTWAGERGMTGKLFRQVPTESRSEVLVELLKFITPEQPVVRLVILLCETINSLDDHAKHKYFVRLMKLLTKVPRENDRPRHANRLSDEGSVESSSQNSNVPPKRKLDAPHDKEQDGWRKNLPAIVNEPSSDEEPRNQSELDPNEPLGLQDNRTISQHENLFTADSVDAGVLAAIHKVTRLMDSAMVKEAKSFHKMIQREDIARLIRTDILYCDSLNDETDATRSEIRAPKNKFDVAMAAGNYDSALKALLEPGANRLDQVEGFLAANFDFDFRIGSLDGDSIVMAILSAREELSEDYLALFSKKLFEHDTNGIGTRLLFASTSGCVKLQKESLIDGALADFRELKRGSKKHKALVCIVNFVSVEEISALLDEYLIIGDVDLHISALAHCVPYLPQDQIEGVLTALSDESIYGKQIVGLSNLLNDLAGSLNALNFPEVVTAASQLHSEWWVVEALTMGCRRLTTESEFTALLNVRNNIVNLDLRATFLGRVSERASDLGFIELAAHAANSIELPMKRFEYLISITSRLASVGNLDGALLASSLIDDEERRSRAGAELVMELGAIGRLKDARLVLEKVVSNQRWVQWVRDRMVDLDEADVAAANAEGEIESRLDMRAKVDSKPDLCVAVQNSVKILSLELPGIDWAVLNEVAVHGDELLLKKRLVEILGANTDFTEGLNGIGTTGREKAFLTLAALTPLIYLQGGAAAVKYVALAINDVRKTWP